jgi:hypothetical protein
VKAAKAVVPAAGVKVGLAVIRKVVKVAVRVVRVDQVAAKAAVARVDQVAGNAVAARVVKVGVKREARELLVVGRVAAVKVPEEARRVAKAGPGATRVVRVTAKAVPVAGRKVAKAGAGSRNLLVSALTEPGRYVSSGSLRSEYP